MHSHISTIIIHSEEIQKSHHNRFTISQTTCCCQLCVSLLSQYKKVLTILIIDQSYDSQHKICSLITSTNHVPNKTELYNIVAEKGIVESASIHIK
jgi:hypothetical protein